jgi:cytochrome P450
MKRNVVRDTEIGGHSIKEGDKVVMWYTSGNHDEDTVENADCLLVNRDNAANHLSFGFGIHRCVGSRVAELQLRIAWEEILKRFRTIEVVGSPERLRSHVLDGYLKLPVLVQRF